MIPAADVTADRGPVMSGVRFRVVLALLVVSAFTNLRGQTLIEHSAETTTTPPDRVRTFSWKPSGGRYAALFDGSEKVLSWDNIPWITRSVLTP